MQGGSFLRLALLAIAGFLAYQYFLGGSRGAPQGQPIAREPMVTPSVRQAYQYCEIGTEHFEAQLTTRGAALTHFKLRKPKYKKHGEPIDLSTTPHPGVALGSPRAEDPSAPGLHEFRQQLFSQWRNSTSSAPADTAWNVDFDSMDYTLERQDGKSCEFVYRDAKVELHKTVKATDRPYELEVTHQIKNLDSVPRAHAMAIDTVAWHRTVDVEGHMFRVSPYVTHAECVPLSGKAERYLPADFEPDDFKDTDRHQVLKPWGWYESRATPDLAALSNAYFTQGVAHVEGSPPKCQLLVENLFKDGQAKDPASGSFYRARLAYPVTTLAPGESARYVELSYVGPKERSVLALAGGANHRFLELIDLGFFSVIAEVLVAFLLKVYGVVPNWGVAIIVLTLTARLLLFPLSWPGIRNMVRMRELKPEMDALNEKFKDDPQAKGLAQMELWRKHNVNPLKGCLPQLASMPVWLALYTTLQTAVELFNIPFLWFPDLSESDPWFVLPVVIGGTYFLQQKLMPMQGGDPAQQKMMMYFMPAMFTVFMLFLPSGLGVYMFTNSVLAIVQQQVVERQVKKTSAKAKAASSRPPVLGKGKV
ncbi:MAG TPA: YidC/Oxa1 family insertase periplasmic-domain containing protein [Polyangiaceae bacterium]|nr:YidC/Oxa1 family insertase periplasmic-domain containing protein [Polyangiaceae bacterium]